MSTNSIREQSSILAGGLGTTPPKAVEALVERLLAARKAYERSEIQFLAFVRTIEQTEEATWKHLGSFSELLLLVGRPSPAKYANYKMACEKLGEKTVADYGLHAAMQLVKVEAPARKKLEESYAAWRAEKGGVHISEEYARQIRQQVVPESKEIGPVRRSHELERLRTENRELRAECERLRKRVTELEERVRSRGGKPATTLRA